METALNLENRRQDTSDQSLVCQALNDTAAFGRIYDRYLPQIYVYIYYRVGQRSIAEDISAQVFERALRKLETYRADRASLATWLFRIARHAIIDHRRRQRLRKWIGLETVEALPTADPGPAELTARRDEFEQLYTHLTRLSKREQEIIALKFASELSHHEIGRLLNLSESNVGTILHRAIRKLRGLYAQED